MSEPRRPGNITIQQLLNCLDGLATQHGVVVVATANDPSKLDPAILRRPGRFDRVVAFPLPSLELRTDYLRRLSCGELDEETILRAARESEKLTFAQLREAYILTGQRAFCDGSVIEAGDLISAIQTVRAEGNPATTRPDSKSLGFESHTASSRLGSSAPTGRYESLGQLQSLVSQRMPPRDCADVPPGESLLEALMPVQIDGQTDRSL